MYLTIQRNDAGVTSMELHTGIPTYQDMVAAVGGYICIAGGARSENGRRIDVWCDDEGLLKDRTPVAAIGDTLRSDAPYAIAGGLIITATDAQGETVAMTQAEVDRVQCSNGMVMYARDAKRCSDFKEPWRFLDKLNVPIINIEGAR